jgi:carbon monoxide dehydrogenase subunit G
MTLLSATVDVDASPEHIWGLLTDWSRQGEWIPVTDVTVAGGPSAGLGTRLSGRTGVGPLGFTDPMEVDVWEPPWRLEVAHLGRLVTGRGVFLVEDAGDGWSRLTWQERLDSTGVRRLVDRAGAHPGQWVLHLALRRFAGLAAQPDARSAA